MDIAQAPVEHGENAVQIAGFAFNPDTLQTVATTLGQSYELSFWRYQDGFAGAGNNPTVILTVTWDGTTVFSEANPGVDALTLTRISPPSSWERVLTRLFSLHQMIRPSPISTMSP